MARYRAQIVEQSGEKQSPEHQKALWDRATPVELHKLAWTMTQQNRVVELDDLRRSRPVLVDLANAARHLVLARSACPLLPKPHLLLAELSPLFPSIGEESPHLNRMRKLANADADLLKESSLVELQAGRTDQAFQDWRRIVELSPDRLPHLVAFTAKELGMVEKIDQLLPSDPIVIINLAQDYFSDAANETIRNRLLNRATELLMSPDISDDERNYIQGIILGLRNDDKAIEYMTKAVQLRPENTQWRYRLAVFLQKAGKLDAAHEHAVLCVRMDPDNEQYSRLLKELIHSRLSPSEIPGQD
jgi:tetratricopeptide (TPR) repeat protein